MTDANTHTWKIFLANENLNSIRIHIRQKKSPGIRNVFIPVGMVDRGLIGQKACLGGIFPDQGPGGGRPKSCLCVCVCVFLAGSLVGCHEKNKHTQSPETRGDPIKKSCALVVFSVFFRSPALRGKIIADKSPSHRIPPKK